MSKREIANEMKELLEGMPLQLRACMFLLRAEMDDNDRDIVNLLYARGTLLHYIVLGDNKALFKKLMRSRFGDILNLDQVNFEGDTPIQLAARHEHIGMVRLLMSEGAKFDIENIKMLMNEMDEKTQYPPLKELLDDCKAGELTSCRTNETNVKIGAYPESKGVFSQMVEKGIPRMSFFSCILPKKEAPAQENNNSDKKYN